MFDNNIVIRVVMEQEQKIFVAFFSFPPSFSYCCIPAISSEINIISILILLPTENKKRESELVQQI